MDRVGDMKWKIMNDIYAVKAKKTHLCFWSPNPPNFFQARFLTLHFFSRKLSVSITISFFFLQIRNGGPFVGCKKSVFVAVSCRQYNRKIILFK